MKEIKKVVKREIFIREYDYEKIFQRDAKRLYDRVSWEPVTADWCAKQHTWATLKDDNYAKNIYGVYEYPHSMVVKLKPKLYDKRYIDWLIRYDNEGYLTVRSRTNVKPSRMGWARVEKDIYEN